ncbi:MAG: methyl-accepting chemotaxis protein [Ferrovibrio sp.]|uniref:methyl-accepting chemotaxis protein n=1 Tax=Ferrovibrio sp. TaxID=1917215 RepID=UPI00391DCD70
MSDTAPVLTAIDKAVSAHAQWKNRLRVAVETRQSDITPDHACKDNLCQFGKWLYGDALGISRAEKGADYEAIRHMHAEFHVQAAETLKKALAGDRAGYDVDTAPTGRFHIISTELTQALLLWHRRLQRQYGAGREAAGSLFGALSPHALIVANAVVSLGVLLLAGGLLVFAPGLAEGGARYGLIGLVAAGLVVSLLLCLSLSRLVGGNLRTAIRAVEQLSRGDYGIQVPGGTRQDDFGDLARGVITMQEAAIDAARVHSAVNGTRSGIVVCDTAGRIVFANNAMLDMLGLVEGEIQKHHAGFRADSLLGQPLGMLHEGMQGRDAKAVIADFARPLRHAIGHMMFEIEAAPARNRRGEQIGAVLQWSDVSQLVTVEHEISGLVQKANAGDFSQRLALENKSGFMRDIARGINDLVGTFATAVDEIDRVASGLADGDLTQRVAGNYSGKLRHLQDSLNGMTLKLTDFAAKLRDSVEVVRVAANDISDGSEDLAGRTESQAAQLEQSVAAMHEVTQTVKQSSDHAQEANRLSGEARRIAERGGSVVEQAVAAMGRIEGSAAKVVDIVGLIDEIAFQTNLLALNASVEAARAGEAGKGFAVVAQEVRALAQRSANASKDIKALITESNTEVNQGAGLVKQTGEALSEIVGAVQNVSGIIGEIANASQEQTTALNEVNIAFTAMDEITQKNAALVEETHASTQMLANQSNMLAGLVRFFRTGGTEQERRTSRREAGGPNDHVTFSGRQVRLCNWSSAGLLFGPMDNPPPANKDITVKVDVDIDGRMFSFDAEVKVARVTDGYVGVGFRRLDPEIQTAIRRHFGRE